MSGLSRNWHTIPGTPCPMPSSCAAAFSAFFRPVPGFFRVLRHASLSRVIKESHHAVRFAITRFCCLPAPLCRLEKILPGCLHAGHECRQREPVLIVHVEFIGNISRFFPPI